MGFRLHRLFSHSDHHGSELSLLRGIQGISSSDFIDYCRLECHSQLGRVVGESEAHSSITGSHLEGMDHLRSPVQVEMRSWTG